MIHGDCVEVMQELEEDSVDCIIADPPYNISLEAEDWDWKEKKWAMVDEEWDETSWAMYQKFTEAWIEQASKVLKPTGTIWTFTTYHNYPQVNLAYREYGEILNDIVWFKRNAFPNLSGRRFTASHETLVWGHLNGEDRDYKFNYEETKEWPLECDGINDEGKQVRSVWDIPTNKTKVEQQFDHPTQKPLRVLERLVRCSTDKDDVILDPFAGSGSTLVSANLNNRNYIGIEREEEYVELAEEFLETVTEKPEKVAAETEVTLHA